jgi:ABC-type transport system involved in Fe-S cluster assembly fused permease/ATPase subunit
MQLYSPLNQLGYLYRSINQSLVDTEKLLALLNEPTEVSDKPNAPDLIAQDGEIEFGSFPHLPRIYIALTLNSRKCPFLL